MVNVNTCSTDKSESKGVTIERCYMVNSEVKDTKDEALVTDNLVIKALGHFKLFKCGKTFFNNLDAMYDRACMENAKYKYWTEMYDTITNYNDWNHTPLSNTNIRE